MPCDHFLQPFPKHYAQTCPLQHAASNAHEAAIVFFIENGADIECKNVHGETPLHLCARARDLARKDLYINCINRLVELKAILKRKTTRNIHHSTKPHKLVKLM